MNLNKFTESDWMAFAGTEETRDCPALIACNDSITIIVDIQCFVNAFCNKDGGESVVQYPKVLAYEEMKTFVENLPEDITFEELQRAGWEEL